MAKKATQSKELLNGDLIASSLFSFDSMKMDKFLSWNMKLVLKTVLPQTFRQYKLVLSLNEEPYQTKIEALDRNIAEIEADGQNELFEGGKKGRIKAIKEEIREVEQELEEMRGMAKEISFFGSIQKLEYKYGDTIIVVTVPGEVVGDINNIRTILKDYKVDLIRE